MTVFKLSIALWVWCLLFSLPSRGQPSAVAGRIKRLYVEPFTMREGAEKLRTDLMAELRRRMSSITLVLSESSADAVLGGGGEIWIRGYRSLNPRSGRLAIDGTPVYAGYLSVELRDAKGQTFWSDLVTPTSATADDVPGEISKRIARHVADALQQITPPAPALLPGAKIRLTGAGATFPYPVYAKWFTNYRRANPNVEITYDAIGSEAGVRRLLEGSVDWGASDSPEVIHEIAPNQEGKYLLFPTVVGAVVPIVNLPGFAGEVNFTPEALAGIYLGKIKRWNDPVLARANRGAHLPDLEITVIHRSDGSGTSYAWSDYLSAVSAEWKKDIGSSLAPKWPAGRGANGNEGVAETVKEFGGSIGYVEFIYALKNHLSYGKVRNAKGEFIGASLESIAAAVRQAMAISDDLKVSLVDPPGTGAYPICTFTWFVIPSQIRGEGKREAIEDLLKWILGPGQTQAAALGYLALPKDLITRDLAALSRIH